MTELHNITSVNPQSQNSEFQNRESESVHLHPVLEKMAEEAVRLKAADIFISPGFPPAWKIDGKVMPALTKPLTAEDTAKIVMTTMTRAQRQKFLTELELNYSVNARNGVRFRMPTMNKDALGWCCARSTLKFRPLMVYFCLRY